MPPPLPPVLPQHTSSPAPAPPSYRSPHPVAVASAGSARKVIMVQQDPGMKLLEDAETLASSRLSNDHRQKSNAHAPDQAQKCPRCESLNTKFCYYNNYSLTQPRHFCKNCRRYWTKGGALRNVPVGGGSRKNKSRVKQRSADPSCLVDEPHMLTQINIGNCSPLLPSFSGPSSSAFTDLSNDNQSHRYGLAFSNLHESMRIAEQSGAVPSNQGLFNLGPGSSQITAPLQLNSSSGQPSSLINSMSSFDTSFMQGLGYPNPSSRPDQQSVMYHGSDLGSLFETPTHVAAAVSSVPPTLEDHLSSFGMPGSGSGMDPRMRFHQNRAAFQMVNDGHGHEEQGRILRGFDEETHDSLRRMKGRSDVRSLSEWQGVSDNLFESGSDGNFWTLPE